MKSEFSLSDSFSDKNMIICNLSKTKSKLDDLLTDAPRQISLQIEKHDQYGASWASKAFYKSCKSANAIVRVLQGI